MNCVPVHATFSFHDGTHVDVVMGDGWCSFSERAVGVLGTRSWSSTFDNRQSTNLDCRLSKIENRGPIRLRLDCFSGISFRQFDFRRFLHDKLDVVWQNIYVILAKALQLPSYDTVRPVLAKYKTANTNTQRLKNETNIPAFQPPRTCLDYIDLVWIAW